MSRDHTCSIEGCESAYYAKSYCSMHYRRWKRNGDPLIKSLKPPRPPKPPRERKPTGEPSQRTPRRKRQPRVHRTREERFWAKVDRGPGMCWNWTAATNDRDYGVFAWNSARPVKFEYAHRSSLMLHGIEIPEDKTVDHICFNPKCVKPSHLRLLSKSDNARRHKQMRPSGFCGVCSSPKVTAPSGRTYCRECNRRHMAEYTARQRALAASEGAL